jgi:tetratricopeptide (TPR) repeat protein
LNNAASEQDTRKAIGLFQQALARDPRDAPAYVGLALGYISMTDFYLAPRETMPQAKAAAIRALGLDETLADAHVALGWIHTAYDWEWSAAEKEFRRALELEPNSADAHDGYGNYLTVVGRSEEAMAEIRRARELDPLSVSIHSNALVNLFMLKRYPEALERGRMIFELDPNNGFAHTQLALVYVQLGRRYGVIGNGRACPLGQFVRAFLKHIALGSCRGLERPVHFRGELVAQERLHFFPFEVKNAVEPEVQVRYVELEQLAKEAP